jgi:hypothetical protein
MNIKRILKSAIASVSMLAAFAGTGLAATVDINIYGASAQYLYWNAAAPGMFANMGCTAVQQAQMADGKNAITRATCGLDTVYMRVSAKASFDGIESLKGIDANAGSAERCDSGDPGYPGASLAPYYREMVDENSCTFTTPPSVGACSAKKCARVTLGASDVSGESFTQSSSGQLKGPLGGGSITRNFTGISTSGLSSYNPLVVPFAFFANTSVTRDLNYGGTPNYQTIDNITRMMAVMIFSGQAWYWADFGADFNGNNIVACMRHAGSGTHATIDYAVMNGKWGANLVATERTGGPFVYFNDGSSDMMKCINGSGLWNGAGAIGYADADQSTSGYANTVRLNYNGVPASRANIRNGIYDFWSTQWAYEDPTAPGYANTHPYIVSMMNYAANPNNIPGASSWGSDKTLWWAAKSEMWYMKNSDQLYPQYIGASNPQLP